MSTSRFESELFKHCPYALIFPRGGQFLVWTNQYSDDPPVRAETREDACKKALLKLRVEAFHRENATG